jgi:hypothetical protein
MANWVGIMTRTIIYGIGGSLKRNSGAGSTLMRATLLSAVKIFDSPRKRSPTSSR